MKFKKDLLLVLVIVIFVSFFLPWVSIESKALGNVVKLLTGKDQTASYSISGYKVPVLANSDQSKLMIAIIKIFAPDITNADKKSYLIWIIPLLAIVIYLVGNSPIANK